MIYTPTVEHAAYEATAEFQAYWAAYQVAEKAHEVLMQTTAATATRAESDDARKEWNAACAESGRLLQIARQTAEHKAAFGW